MAHKRKKGRRGGGSDSRYRPKVKLAVKEALYREAGYKCANPGCPGVLLELHHINQWHVYQTHDQATMIAVCPTCHEHAHRGLLRIDNVTICRWKSLRGETSDRIDILPRRHVYVEPSKQCSLLLGTLRFANAPNNTTGLTLFELSPNNVLGFRIADGDVLQLNLRIANTSGNEILRVVDGHLTYTASPPLAFEARTGKYQVRAPATAECIPGWVLEQYNSPDEPLVQDGAFTLVGIEVVAPGIVKVQGVWFDDGRAVIIAQDHLALCRPPRTGFFYLCGYREVLGDLAGDASDPRHTPIIQYEGAITFAILEKFLSPFSKRSSD